jgi:hypothetical protein
MLKRKNQLKRTSAFALMFGREPNNYDDFADTATETFNQDAWEKHLDEMKMSIF